MRPKAKRKKTARLRRASALSPVALTMAERASVKKVKLPTKPTMMPSGLFSSCETPPAKIIGKRGRMQGERMVTKPPMKAKIISSGMLFNVGN